MSEVTHATDVAGAAIRANNACGDTFDIGFVFNVECRDRDGILKWVDESHNTVTTVGKTDMLSKYFLGSSYTAAWYMGLKNTGSISSSDTMSSHAGWTENVTYSQGTRPQVSFDAASAGSIANSVSKAIFSITGTTTIVGCFLCSDSTKSGSNGILYDAVDFSSSRNVLSGDTLSVQITLSIS